MKLRGTWCIWKIHCAFEMHNVLSIFRVKEIPNVPLILILVLHFLECKERIKYVITFKNAFNEFTWILNWFKKDKINLN